MEVIDDLTTDQRAAYKRSVDVLDDLAAEGGMHCGIPAGFFLCPESMAFSRTYIESLVTGLGGKIPKTEIQEPPKEVTDGDWVLHRSWYVRRQWRGQFGIAEIWRNRITSKFEMDFQEDLPFFTSLEMKLKSVAYLTLYGIEEAEMKAHHELEAMLNQRQRRQLLLTSSFYEQGRSGVIYWIRKNQMTIAIRSDETTAKDGQGTPICALCLHPMGWYVGTFAGMLTPSDDMMAHLLMIRANEHYYWRKAAQHKLDIRFPGIC